MGEDGSCAESDKAVLKADLLSMLKNKKLSKTKFCEVSEVSLTTLNSALKGQKISAETAEKISNAFKIKTKDIFEIEKNIKALSNKTIIEHHRLISTILSQAEKEMLVPFNAASKATPPKLDKKEVNYFEPEALEKIRDCLENEPIKWKLCTHLLLITGCRRGEIAGLKWSKIDFDHNQIKIDTSLLFSKERGIYEDTTKTDTTRFIKLPPETMDLIK